MPLCSYLVIPKAGRCAQVAARLGSLPGCEVERAHNRELLILLTETRCSDEEAQLRRSLAALEGVDSIVLTFGELGVSDVIETGAPPP